LKTPLKNLQSLLWFLPGRKNARSIRVITDNRGLSFLFVIFALTTLVALGAGIYTLTTSSLYTELNESSRNQAYQVALGGLNYAGEQYWRGTNLLNLDNQTFTLANNRGQFHLAVAMGSGAYAGFYQVTSTGIVNTADGNLLARVQLAAPPDRFPGEPPVNQEIMRTTFRNLNALDAQSLRDDQNRTIIRIGEYVATGGTHLYWAAITNLGAYPHPDADNPGCNIGFHVGRLDTSYVQQLRQSWRDYRHVNYDVQIKTGWYKELQGAVSGLNFRWHEVGFGSGKYEGYGLAFMRFTYNQSGCASGYDYIPNSIKPDRDAAGNVVDLRYKLLLVLWEQRVEAGEERRRWLAYADLGNPAVWPNPRSGNDLKVTGAQDNVDGLLSDNSILIVRAKDKFVLGRRINEITAFYGDASPYYDASPERIPGSVCTNIHRKRMPPEWVDASRFPTWPSNRLDNFAYTEMGVPYNIINFWGPQAPRSASYYDYFTLPSASPKIGPEPPSSVPVLNPVRWILNPLYADPDPDPDIIPADLNRVKLLPNKGVLRTYKFILDDFNAQTPEIGLHGMGNLNNSDRVVAFDDMSIQIIGLSEF
jgi:hypothetical protein